MSNDNNKSASPALGFTGLLTIVFITLKLLNVIEWSWLWVLSPIWISVALVILGAILGVLIPFIVAIFATIFAKNKKNK